MLVTLTRFVDPWEAQVVRARLDAEGIPATVAFAHHAVMNWPMSLALGGTAVQVPSVLLERSRALMADYEAGVLEQALNDATGLPGDHCPRCSSLHFRRTMHWHRRLFAMIVVVLFAPYPTRRNLLICRDCGCQWAWGE